MKPLLPVCFILMISSTYGIKSSLDYIHSMRNQLAQHLKLKENYENPEPSTKQIRGESEQELYNFRGDAIKTQNKNVDNIFSLLADIEPQTPDRNVEISAKPSPAPFRQDIPMMSNSIDVDSHNLDIINDFTKKALSFSNEVENLASTVSKVKFLYEKKKAEHDMIKSYLPQKKEEEPDSSVVLDVFLNSTNLEKMWDTTVKSKEGDEILEELASVIIGAEDRSGSALTLDPVTIIALLTLAAYLIRAVYQILTVTGRSLDVGSNPARFPLGFSDLPHAMASVHNWISPSKVEYSSFPSSDGRSIETSDKTWLNIPGTVLGLVKLQREGDNGCYQKMLCQHLTSRKSSAVSSEDLFIMISNYMYGMNDFELYIDNALGLTPDCSKYTGSCPDSKLKEAEKIQLMYSSAANYLYSYMNKPKK